MQTAVCIRGDSVAACCCARLLSDRQHTVLLDPQTRTRVPALLLNQSSQSLLADTFVERALFAGLHSIQRRIVAWGPSATPNVLPHSALVIPEGLLVQRLWANTSATSPYNPSTGWTVVTAGDIASYGTVQHFGSRTAVGTPVELLPDVPDDACWIESVENGWLFLISSGEGHGTLLSVGAPRAQLVEESRLIGPLIAVCETDSPAFPVYPRILSPLTGSGWLACGTAAIGFDPVCGEGVGNAVREAILVAAVLRALFRGSDPYSVLMHYSARLLTGFHRHLKMCVEYYTSARCSSWWDGQIELLHAGIVWTEKELKKCAAPRYRLVDFDLQEVS
jgi:hypothetical protein